MPTPTITSVELPNGGEVLLSPDAQTVVANEITIYGSNLGNTTAVELDSGDDYEWVVASISPSSNSIIVNAFAFAGGGSGGGGVAPIVHSQDGNFRGPTAEAYFVFPIID